MAQLSPDAKAALVCQYLDDGVPLTRLAAAAGLPVRTVRRWAAIYRTDRTTAVLQRQPRSDLGLRTLAHQGDAAYRDQFELVHRRTAARPNEQWQADHTLLDVQVWTPRESRAGRG